MPPSDPERMTTGQRLLMLALLLFVAGFYVGYTLRMMQGG